MRIGLKLPNSRFLLLTIGYAALLYHRFTLSDRDVEELHSGRGIQVSRESNRARWPLDEMYVVVAGVTHWGYVALTWPMAAGVRG